ncbi:MAG: glycosyltransferase [bacterium]
MPHLALVVHSYVDEDPRVRRAARAAVAAGWRVSIVSLQRDGDAARGMLDGAELYRQPVQRHQGAGISTYVLEYGRFATLAARQLLRIDRENTIDVVHANSVPDWLVFAALPLRRRHKIGLILDLHEASPELFRMRFARSSRSRFTRVAARAMVSLVAFAERRSIRVADWVFVTAPRLRERLIKIAPRRAGNVEVILNVPESQRFSAASKDDRSWMSDGILRLIYTGALTPIYEVDVIIRAVALLRSAPSPLPARLVIAGRGDQEPTLRALTVELGISDAVEFIGRVPFDAVPALIRDADIALAPTRLDEFTDLSISNKVFEGMASGRLVLGTRLKTLDDLVPEASVARYTSGSAEEAAAVLRRLAADPEERASRIESGLAAIRGGLSWEAAGAAYVRRLTALLPPPGDPR